MTYPLNNAFDSASNGNGKAVAWEKAFIQLVKVHCTFISYIHFLGCGIDSLDYYEELL